VYSLNLPENIPDLDTQSGSFVIHGENMAVIPDEPVSIEELDEALSHLSDTAARTADWSKFADIVDELLDKRLELTHVDTSRDTRHRS
jgi:hypothetical protein